MFNNVNLSDHFNSCPLPFDCFFLFKILFFTLFPFFSSFTYFSIKIYFSFTCLVTTISILRYSRQRLGNKQEGWKVVRKVVGLFKGLAMKRRRRKRTNGRTDGQTDGRMYERKGATGALHACLGTDFRVQVYRDECDRTLKSAGLYAIDYSHTKKKEKEKKKGENDGETFRPTIFSTTSSRLIFSKRFSHLITRPTIIYCTLFLLSIALQTFTRLLFMRLFFLLRLSISTVLLLLFLFLLSFSFFFFDHAILHFFLYIDILL